MLISGLDVHLTPGRAQKGLCEFLSAVRAVRRRFAESFGERRLRLDQRRHQLAQNAQISTLFRHNRSYKIHRQSRSRN